MASGKWRSVFFKTQEVNVEQPTKDRKGQTPLILLTAIAAIGDGFHGLHNMAIPFPKPAPEGKTATLTRERLRYEK